MAERQPAARELAFYMTSIALVVSAAGLVRTLFQVLSPATPAPRDAQGGSTATSKASASTESEAIVSDINQGNGKGILVAAVVGVLIGAGVALLCAPQSGRDSREWLARRTRGLKNRVGVASDPSPDVIPNGVTPS